MDKPTLSISMGRETRAKAAIVEAATALFARFGFKKTAVDDIARRARVGKATIYAHFGSKEEVFAAVMRESGRHLLDLLRRAIAEQAEPAAKVRAFIETRMARIRQQGTLHPMSDETLSELLPLATRAREEFFWQEVQLLEDILAAGQASGAFQMSHPRRVALTILSAAQGIDLTFLKMAQTPELEEGIREMLDLLLAGLAAPGRRD